MDQKKDVLNSGFVRLVDSMGSDVSIVRSARVSYDAEWRSGEDAGKDEKLIRYLLKNKHTSPFESVMFTFEIKCPMFIARQWHRHRTWAYSEISARYTELPEDYYVPAPEVIGRQSSHNKQVRDLDGTAPDAAHSMVRTIMEACDQSFMVYRALLSQGAPREMARMVLPMATYTRFFGTVSLHNLLHFIRLRLHPHAQWEIQQYAQALLSFIQPVVPVTAALFMEIEK